MISNAWKGGFQQFVLNYQLQKLRNSDIVRMQSRQKEEQVRKITQEILLRVKSSFETHKRRVEQMNSEKGSNAMKKDNVMHSFFQPIHNHLEELRKLQANIRKCEKLKKDRRQLYEKNIIIFIDTLEGIRKNKHMIKIQINEHLLKTVNETGVIIEEAQANLRNYEKQANVFCGKAYDYKPAVEKSMVEISQYAFFWANLPKLNSIKNDSVQEIYLPVKYQANQFDNIQNQIKNLWPNPQVKVIKEQIKVPQIQVKDDSHLREAHEMFFGFTRSENQPQAIQMYKLQADKQKCHPTALNALGQIYQKGKYVMKDLKKAVHYYKKSADKEDPEGMYKIGQYLEKGLINSKEYFSGLYPNRQAEIRGGIQYYQKAAKRGHLDAMTDLGFIYEKGIKNQDYGGYFIQPHPQHALKYYLKAKKSQFPRSYNNLGTLHITCQSLPEEVENGNLFKGIKYLEKAVMLKYPRAYFNLGKCYENGVGVNQNIDKARSLFLEGAEGGDNQCRLQYIKSYLGQKLHDEKTMMKMVEMSRKILMEDGRNVQALYYMGLFFEKGIGVDKNKESAFYYIETAARLDYAPAITKLGDFYYSGYYVHKDVEYAKTLYEKAAQKMETKAMVNLGVMAEKGIGMEENNPLKAQQLYQQAASLGNPNALIFLSMADKKQSEQVLIKAAQLGSIEAAKIIKDTNRQSMIPKKDHKAKTYTQSLKDMQSMYAKKSVLGTSVFKSQA